MNDTATETHNQQTIDENEIIATRKSKLTELRGSGNAYPNDFKREHFANDLVREFGELSHDELEAKNHTVTLAGRMVLRRLMGKASFIHLQDMTGRIQAYIKRDDLPEGIYQSFKNWDLGDIVGITGRLFKTKTDELTIHADSIRLLTKSLRPLPDKFHGLTDTESRYRQRYLDLLTNDSTRQVFQTRSSIIEFIRQFLRDRRFLEVETPMMQPIPGGAAARPFITHHNTLDMDLYLRIAPELYLKRLVVGGFERVFEINRNFRNEGISTQHNPEFTMLEFYQAYVEYHDLMDLTEVMLRELTHHLFGQGSLQYQGQTFDFEQPFARYTLKESILEYNNDIRPEELDDFETIKTIAQRLEIPIRDTYGLGKLQLEIFEKTVEHRLMQPTFITEYPTEVSPLARKNQDNPFVTDRFEFFAAGFELANGFSELNDAEDQAQRFAEQAKEKEAGDLEAMHYDADYITALEYGLPPTSGEGIGIDRLTMLFTDSSSIRDVILFPQLKNKP